jgi:GNAT superfamily N-acetyltransferase
MYEISRATVQDQDAILGFLAERGLIYNAWLAQILVNTLHEIDEPVPGKVSSPIVCRNRGKIRGVMTVARYPERVSLPRPIYDVLMEAVSVPAAKILLREVPELELGWFFIHQQVPHRLFDNLSDVSRSCGDLYFTVSAEHFRPVSGDPVVRLTAADQSLFEGCEQQYQWECHSDDDCIFGIVRDGRVVTSVNVGTITPYCLPGPRAIAFSVLHTEAQYRRQGLARRLIGYATETVLREGNLPMYWTGPENIASQGVAVSLGYSQYTRCFHCEWRRPQGWSGKRP